MKPPAARFTGLRTVRRSSTGLPGMTSPGGHFPGEAVFPSGCRVFVVVRKGYLAPEGLAAPARDYPPLQSTGSPGR